MTGSPEFLHGFFAPNADGIMSERDFDAATMRGRLMEMMASSGNGPRGGIDPSVVGEDFGAFQKLLEQAGLM